jgi:Zn-dependent M16 (insulinase) family peptidase
MIQPQSTHLFVTCEEKSIPAIHMKLTNFINNLYQSSGKEEPKSVNTNEPSVQSSNDKKNTFVAKPFPVNFVARTYPLVPYLHPDHPTLRILGAIMAPELHKEIREKGGAYGSRSAIDTTGK